MNIWIMFKWYNSIKEKNIGIIKRINLYKYYKSHKKISVLKLKLNLYQNIKENHQINKLINNNNKSNNNTIKNIKHII